MFSKVSSKNLIANKAKAVHTEICTDACHPCDVWIKFARLLLNRIGSSVIIYVVAQAQPNYPLIIRCKGTTNIWTTQGFNGKNIVYLYF